MDRLRLPGGGTLILALCLVLTLRQGQARLDSHIRRAMAETAPETEAGVAQTGAGEGAGEEAGADACAGRRVFMQDYGAQFHRDLLYGEDEAGAFGRGTGLNGGFGAEKRSSRNSRDPGKVLRGVSSAGSALASGAECSGGATNCTVGEPAGDPGAGAGAGGGVEEHWPRLESTWYDTWANSLDVVFHSRMVAYPCLASSPEGADLVYVVYYGSLDISRHLGKNSLQRGRLGRELALLLAQSPRFQRHGGRDHFVVTGRPIWDFVSNISNPYNPWGTDFFNLPVMEPVKIVTVEASVWRPTSIGAPYATSFHPPSRTELQAWREFVEAHERPYLFAFGGAVRRGARQASIQRAGAIRERVFWQCAASDRCRLLDCENPPRACERDWRVFTQLYLSSTFCVHPHGDSCTRRAVLDGMLAGCIPVVLERCTVEHQYQWLLGHPDNFSVYVDGESLKSPPEADSQAQADKVTLGSGTVMLEEQLMAIPEEKVRMMRNLVLDFIPLITFGGKSHQAGSIQAPDFEDAFDHTVKYLSKIVKEANQP